MWTGGGNGIASMRRHVLVHLCLEWGWGMHTQRVLAPGDFRLRQNACLVHGALDGALREEGFVVE